MEVFFCDRCSARVTEGDLAEGRAFQIHTFVLCKACWDNSEVREAIERRIAEASGVMRIPLTAKQAAGSGRRSGRRKTPRPTSGRRRTPARGTPRRTPVPQGRRRTPGRTSPVNLERVPREQGRRHDTMSRRRPDAPAPSGLPKLVLLAIVGLCLGLMAFLFLGGKKDPELKRPSRDSRGDTSESRTDADPTETSGIPAGTDSAATNPAIDDSGGSSLRPVPGPGVMGTLRSGEGFKPEFGPGVAEITRAVPTPGSATGIGSGASAAGGAGPGLIAHWKFDEDPGAAMAIDAAGNCNGSISDPRSMPGHDGRIGGAYRFDGDDRIETLMPGPHNMHLTWSAWIRTTKGGALLANTGQTWAQGGKSLFVKDGTVRLDVGWVKLVDTGLKVNDGVWHHVALTVVDSGESRDPVAIFIDGVERKKIEDIDFFKYDGTSARMRIGHCPQMGGYFDGYVDDVRIYGRALSAAEVQALYMSQPVAPGSRDAVKTPPAVTPADGREAGLIAHWKFDEGPGSATAVDAGGKHNGSVSDPRNMPGHRGRIGGAYRFVATGQDDYVDAGAPLLKGVGEYTLAGWINPASLPQPGKPGLWGQDDNCEFGFWGSDIVWWTAKGDDRVTVAYPYPANQWHHIAIVAKQKMKNVYFDGQEHVWNEGFDGACDNGNYNFKIGGGGIWDGKRPGWFDGMIDDVRVYNRALSDAEVKALYESR